MPRIIQTFHKVFPEELVVIRSASLRTHLAGRALVDEARRNAKRIVARAEQEALEIRQRAISHGHVDGLARAAYMLAEYLSMHGDIVRHWRDGMMDELRRLLKQSLTNPDVLLSALEQCITEGGMPGQQCLEVLVPKGVTLDVKLVEERLRALFGDTKVDVQRWEGESLLLRAGDHVAELAVEPLIGHTVRRLIDGISPVHESCRRLADEYRQRVAEAFLTICEPKVESWHGADGNSKLNSELEEGDGENFGDNPDQ